MKRAFVIALMLALMQASVGQAQGVRIPRFGSATLDAIGGSAVRARIAFIDNGVDLIALGTATGLDRNETYFSNIYDVGSVATGANACEPTIFDPEDRGFILPRMFLGTWEVDAAGIGKLSAVNTNNGEDFVPLRRFKTVSIRRFVAPGSPPQTVLEACGEVSIAQGSRPAR